MQKLMTVIFLFITLLLGSCTVPENEYLGDRVRDGLDVVTVGITGSYFVGCRIGCLCLGFNSAGLTLRTYNPDGKDCTQYDIYESCIPYSDRQAIVSPSNAAIIRGKGYLYDYWIPCLAFPKPIYSDSQDVFKRYYESFEKENWVENCTMEEYFGVPDAKDSPNFQYAIKDLSTDSYFCYQCQSQFTTDTQLATRFVFAPKNAPDYTYYSNIYVDAGMIMGVHVRANPIELIDFVLGFTTLDIVGDDQTKTINQLRQYLP